MLSLSRLASAANQDEGLINEHNYLNASLAFHATVGIAPNYTRVLCSGIFRRRRYCLREVLDKLMPFMVHKAALLGVAGKVSPQAPTL